VDHDTFIDLVARRARVSPERAMVLSRATLETLADRLTSGQALDLAAQLPKSLQGLLRPPEEKADRFDAREFVRRFSERAEVEPTTAGDGIRAVFRTVHEALTGGEFDDVVAQLPADYADLVAPVARPARLA
jgi:uncharacterized protein (DUF2267 family)